MTWAKLRQLSKDMTNQDIRERFHWIGIIRAIQLPLDGVVLLAEFIWYFLF